MTTLHAGLHLLDHQLLDDATGRMLGKVDDLELDLTSDPPVATALLRHGEPVPVDRVAAVDSAVRLASGPEHGSERGSESAIRLRELLGRPVVDSTGRELGGVGDVVLVRSGPMLRVSGLIVIEHRHARLLGYERDVRPALFRVVVRRLAGDVLNVPWEQVAAVTDEVVALDRGRADLTVHDRSMRS